jgi:hypothetical protein
LDQEKSGNPVQQIGTKVGLKVYNIPLLFSPLSWANAQMMMSALKNCDETVLANRAYYIFQAV